MTPWRRFRKRERTYLSADSALPCSTDGRGFYILWFLIPQKLFNRLGFNGSANEGILSPLSKQTYLCIVTNTFI